MTEEKELLSLVKLLAMAESIVATVAGQTIAVDPNVFRELLKMLPGDE